MLRALALPEASGSVTVMLPTNMPEASGVRWSTELLLRARSVGASLTLVTLMVTGLETDAASALSVAITLIE